MSDSSANLGLPYIQPAQAQKHVTHNEALRRLDTLVQLSVASASTQTPPAAPTSGTRYIVPAGATGVWTGNTDALATFEDNGWIFYTPSEGWTAWVSDTAQLMTFQGTGWTASTAPDLQNLAGLGIGATSDANNPLVVAGGATLLNHAGAGHQLKLNKAAPTDTASLLFQTGFSGRAEMGTAGSDDFEIKVSADGTTFNQSLVADAATGVVRFPSGVSGLTQGAFGTGPLTTTGYVLARGTDLVTNGTGLLGNGYNYPDEFDYDPVTTPNLPASFSFSGHYPGVVAMSEVMPLDPNQCYRLSSYVQQEALAGDWSAFSNAENHTQYMGLLCMDADGESILSSHHMRYKSNGTDSRTTLAAPLAPGDTTVQLVDASGWNDSNTASHNRGIIIFGYSNAAGYKYTDYSRLVTFDMFDVAGVNKATNTITLNAPLATDMGNPDDPAGVWPAGTVLANSTSAGSYKYAFYNGYRPAQAGTWYKTTNYIGGIDRSGTNVENNFPPGMTAARILWLPNYSNRVGGSGGSPDTGAGHRVWYAGVSVQPEPLAAFETQNTGSSAGRQNVKVPVPDYSSGAISLQTPGFTVQPV